MIALEVFKKILENGDKFPLLPLDEFLMEIQKRRFDYANQWEDGRPLDEMWKKNYGIGFARCSMGTCHIA